ncbi:MAG: hypothetical protein ABIR59_13555 [Gemmatimonadales bacterium]
MRRIAAILLLALGAACNAEVREVAPIRLDPIGTLGSDADSAANSTWSRVSPLHPQGYRILVPQPGGVPALPAVYGEDGKYLGVLGTSGDGPGEFREPLFVRFGPGDSLYVFDGAQRVLVFSPSREYARTIMLPVAPWDAAVFADGRMVVASATHDHGLPLLVIGADGTVVQEIGGSDSASMATVSPRRIVTAPDGTIWTMPMTGSWRVEHWDLSGKLLTAHDRAPAWYPIIDAAAVSDMPRPSVQDAWFDSAGRFWVLGKALDEHWKKGVDRDVDSATDTTTTIDDPDKAHDTIVEVFDVASWKILAEARFDPSYPFAVERGIVMRVRVENGGRRRAELARLVLDTTRIGATEP